MYIQSGGKVHVTKWQDEDAKSESYRPFDGSGDKYEYQLATHRGRVHACGVHLDDRNGTHQREHNHLLCISQAEIQLLDVEFEFGIRFTRLLRVAAFEVAPTVQPLLCFDGTHSLLYLLNPLDGTLLIYRNSLVRMKQLFFDMDETQIGYTDSLELVHRSRVLVTGPVRAFAGTVESWDAKKRTLVLWVSLIDAEGVKRGRVFVELPGENGEGKRLVREFPAENSKAGDAKKGYSKENVRMIREEVRAGLVVATCREMAGAVMPVVNEQCAVRIRRCCSGYEETKYRTRQKAAGAG